MTTLAAAGRFLLDDLDPALALVPVTMSLMALPCRPRRRRAWSRRRTGDRLDRHDGGLGAESVTIDALANPPGRSSRRSLGT